MRFQPKNLAEYFIYVFEAALFAHEITKDPCFDEELSALDDEVYRIVEALGLAVNE